tara:strand:+ start:59525 stop:59812 length:288 start_codon:yes stop_codon:yes gene_type:complete
MQVLSEHEIVLINGGMSETAAYCLEGGAFGGTEGAIAGGLIALPFYLLLTFSHGISATAQTLGLFLMGSGVAGGFILGGMVGTATGYVASCVVDH